MVDPLNTKSWVMVPVEPTEAMLDAADRVRPLPAFYLTEAYRAMLSASPAAESRVLSLEEEVKEAALHVEQLSELLKFIKEHWIDYDHIFSISVHDADTWLAARAALSQGKKP